MSTALSSLKVWYDFFLSSVCSYHTDGPWSYLLRHEIVQRSWSSCGILLRIIGVDITCSCKRDQLCLPFVGIVSCDQQSMSFSERDCRVLCSGWAGTFTMLQSSKAKDASFSIQKRYEKGPRTVRTSFSATTFNRNSTQNPNGV